MQVKTRKNIVLIILCFCIIIGVLFAGLWPLNFFQKNSVILLHEKNGIAFKRYSIAYTNDTINKDTFKDNEITIDLILCSRDESGSSLSHIITFYNIEDGYEDIVICQWRAHLMLFSRNGDFSDINNYRKCGLRYALPVDSTIFLTIASDKKHTDVYINGKPVNKCSNFPLIPDNFFSKERIILGNSPTGKAEWSGEIYALAMYDTLLSEKTALDNFEKWRLNNYLSPAENQILLYNFDEPSGSIVVKNKTSSAYNLLLPPLFKTLKKEALELPPDLFQFKRNIILDIILNILGFIPLGFFLAIGVSQTKFHSKKHIYVETILAGFLISLIIETLQIFLPSRDSSMLDLILNTGGTFIGVLILHIASLFEKTGLRV